MKIHLHLAVIILILVGMLVSSCKQQSNRRTGLGVGSQIGAQLQQKRLELEALRMGYDAQSNRTNQEFGLVERKLELDREDRASERDTKAKTQTDALYAQIAEKGL